MRRKNKMPYGYEYPGCMPMDPGMYGMSGMGMPGMGMPWMGMPGMGMPGMGMPGMGMPGMSGCDHELMHDMHRMICEIYNMCKEMHSMMGMMPGGGMPSMPGMPGGVVPPMPKG